MPSRGDIDAETEGYTRKTHIKTAVLDQERRKWFEYGAQGLRIATGTKSSGIVQDQVTVEGGRGMHMVAVSIASDSEGDSESPRAPLLIQVAEP